MERFAAAAAAAAGVLDQMKSDRNEKTGIFFFFSLFLERFVFPRLFLQRLVGNLQDTEAVFIQMAVRIMSTLSNDSDSPFFFFCCFLDFIFLALLSISTAVCL